MLLAPDARRMHELNASDRLRPQLTQSNYHYRSGDAARLAQRRLLRLRWKWLNFSTCPQSAERRSISLLLFRVQFKRCFHGINKKLCAFWEKYVGRSCDGIMQSSLSHSLASRNSAACLQPRPQQLSRTHLILSVCLLHDRADYINATYEWINNLLTLLPWRFLSCFDCCLFATFSDFLVFIFGRWLSLVF